MRGPLGRRVRLAICIVDRGVMSIQASAPRQALRRTHSWQGESLRISMLVSVTSTSQAFGIRPSRTIQSLIQIFSALLTQKCVASRLGEL